MTIKAILEDLAAQNAFLLPPASAGDIAAADEALAALGVPNLPDDYKQVLTLADGLQFDGFQFFRTGRAVDDPNAGAIGILAEINRQARSAAALAGHVLLGGGELYHYTFDTADNEYKGVDRDDFEIVYEYSTFADLLAEVVDRGF